MSQINYIPKGHTGGTRKHDGWEERPCVEPPEKHLRLVWQVVNRMAAWGTCDKDDLFQEGCIGLIKAAKTFDPSLGFKFSTYAVPWIYSFASRAVESEKIQSGYKRNPKRERYERMVRRVVVIQSSQIGNGEDGTSEYDIAETKPWAVPDEADRMLDAANLVGRERIVIHGRIVEERTLEEIGRELGVTRERIRKIEQSALRKAKNSLGRFEARKRIGARV